MISLAQFAHWANGELQGASPAAEAAIVKGLAIDSRQLRPGEVFVALPGARTDGHCFVAQARTMGAAAAIVQYPQSDKLPQIVVNDGAAAMLQLARQWRRAYTGIMTAVTGSNGKTTVKEMLAAICRLAVGEEFVHCSGGNLNNHLGLPLTLVGLRPHHRLAVVELGMDAPGELTRLAAAAKPDVAVITNAQRAHLGGFASLKDIARAKGEILSSLSPAGVAVLNRDDSHFALWRRLARRGRQISFGFSPQADCRGEWKAGRLHFGGRARPIQLQVAGRHNAMNALAAAAAANAMGMAFPAVEKGLQKFAGVARRLQYKKTPAGGVIIDDTYNANPDSMLAALAVLKSAAGKKIAVLGDMMALGDSAAREHQKIGAAVGDDITLLTIGEQMQHTAAAAAGRHFRKKSELLAALGNLMDGDTCVLVKGSRAMKMEEVVTFLESGRFLEGGR